MTPFLQQVAGHYFRQDAPLLGRRCYVLPGRRAVLFFKKYLSEYVKASDIKASIAPEVLTINEFFYRISGAHNTDRLQLLLTLFECWQKVSGSSETLDEFIFWGDMLLADFGDVDKYLIDPEQIFGNIAELRSMSLDKDYLTPNQKSAIERFVQHFETDYSSKTYKQRFRTVWDLLLPLYRLFDETLQSKAQTYEGRVYRQMAQRFKAESCTDILSAAFPGIESFVFAGLNVLCECEKTVLTKMRNAGIAEFCWDYSSKWIKDPRNKSSFFLKDNIEAYPQAFKIDPDGLKDPEINLISVPSGIGQTKQIARIMQRLGTQTGDDTAIVLPDENQLIPLQNSIPPYIKDINVTMGYPMSGSAIWTVMDDVASLQMHLRRKGDKWYFYHRQVFSLLSNPVIKSIIPQELAEKVEALKKESRYYIPQEDFSGGILEKIFTPIVTDTSSTALISAIENYQQDILVSIANGIKEIPDMEMELDFAREYYLSINKLKAYKGLDVLPATYFRVLEGLIGRCSVPFYGEPLKGLQVMGPLETRALDFENLIILNCNEGTFPRHSRSESFIPPELRRGFGLPTYEYQDAVWAYYFYRMIQRASHVWLMCDSRAEGLHSGEESRYIKQLEMHFGARVNRFNFDVPVAAAPASGDIPKTAEHLSVVHANPMSASALKSYITCPAKFYYSKVQGLKAPKEILESMDASMMGTVFHAVMETLYKPGIITDTYLKGLLESETIRQTISEKILSELKTVEVTGRNLVLAQLLERYVRQVIKRDLELLKTKKLNSFTILGTECRFLRDIEGQKFVGYVDRMDSFEQGTVRIVDYKTGNTDNVDLQLYIYDVLAQPDYKGKTILNSVYQVSRLFGEPVQETVMDQAFMEEMESTVRDTLAQINDLEQPWKRTESVKDCKYCDFKTICGR